MSELPELSPDPAYSAKPPVEPLPIIVVGAGGISRDAHLPAYRKAGFPVAGILDRATDRAERAAVDFGLPAVFDDLAQAVSEFGTDAIYDLAVMPDQFTPTLSALPEGAAVLIQKPLGYCYAEAVALQELTERRRLQAAANTQLRFAPYVRQARELIASDAIGELIDIEIRVSVETRWELFPSVFALDRMEMPMHSIHYVDLVRSFVGDPTTVSAVTTAHPAKALASTRSAYLLHYPHRPLRVTISTNHDHEFGPEHQGASITWQGTRGCLRAQMGLLLDYPRGGIDKLQLTQGDEWRDVPFEGSWFPDAFAGSMGALQRYVTGEAETLPTSLSDAVRTMAVLEAAHVSNQRGGVRLPK